ncbi:hypothetical protein EHH60_24250 [Bradyrhizobium sp. RP6]|nr:hypothetical protein EHH60_24250 [Bradyrhizobium sp. RP6]
MRNRQAAPAAWPLDRNDGQW